MTALIKKEHSVMSICEYVGISRQAYYKRRDKVCSKSSLYQLLEQVVIDNRKVRSRVGLRSIYFKENLSSLLGVNQFEQHMSKLGYALKPYRSFIKTTDSRGHHFQYNNLIAGKQLNADNQVIVGDITYYRNNSELYYIFHFQDYYTLEVKGLIGSKNMEGINAEKCLRQVYAYNNKSKYAYGMILHTDRGGQYRSNKFQEMIRKAQIQPSHATNCLENGLSERANGIVKNEYLIDYDIKNERHLNVVLTKIKKQINEVWPSKTLGYRTPKEYAKTLKQMNLNDRPVKEVKEVKIKRWVY
jgi:putative transposase